MTRNVLYIDDQPDNRALEAFQEELEVVVNEHNSLNSFKVKVTPIIPNDYIDFTKEPIEFNTFFSFLDEKFLNESLDLVMCDFNMHVDHKHMSFHIIDHIRKRNKSCSIILFSGSPLKELIRMNNSDLAKSISQHINEENNEVEISSLTLKLEEIRKNETPAEDLLRKAVSSHISEIVSRKVHEDKAIELIRKPSFLLSIEHELLLHGDVIFNDGHEYLNGKSLSNVASEIRKQTEEGKYFTNLLLQLSLSNLIEMNN